MEISAQQKQFIEFLVQSQVLTFGDFTTKSGRKTPYFVNTGQFNSGDRIAKVGEFYASKVLESVGSDISTIFGPAYKGVPLAVATSTALHLNHDLSIGFSFDRKEEKTHGDKGMIVGKKIKPGDKLVIVEDVVTAGTTLKKITPVIRNELQAEIVAVIISVDRCEKGSSELSAVAEMEQQLGLNIKPIVNIHQIKSHLSSDNSSGVILSDNQQKSVDNYLEQYGA